MCENLCDLQDYMLPLQTVKNAAIAQLVEHNLAKVGVASSSLVCRSFLNKPKRRYAFCLSLAQVAELVDAHVSGACVSRRAGSSPVLGTVLFRKNKNGEVAELVDALL